MGKDTNIWDMTESDRNSWIKSHPILGMVIKSEEKEKSYQEEIEDA